MNARTFRKKHLHSFQARAQLLFVASGFHGGSMSGCGVPHARRCGNSFTAAAHPEHRTRFGSKGHFFVDVLRSATSHGEIRAMLVEHEVDEDTFFTG